MNPSETYEPMNETVNRINVDKKILTLYGKCRAKHEREQFSSVAVGNFELERGTMSSTKINERTKWLNGLPNENVVSSVAVVFVDLQHNVG